MKKSRLNSVFVEIRDFCYTAGLHVKKYNYEKPLRTIRNVLVFRKISCGGLLTRVTNNNNTNTREFRLYFNHFRFSASSRHIGEGKIPPLTEEAGQ